MPIEADALLPVELGHMVFGEGGPRCRCGHHGCVEAYTSLPALAELLGVGEPELLQLGRRVGERDPDLRRACARSCGAGCSGSALRSAIR